MMMMMSSAIKIEVFFLGKMRNVRIIAHTQYLGAQYHIFLRTTPQYKLKIVSKRSYLVHIETAQAKITYPRSMDWKKFGSGEMAENRTYARIVYVHIFMCIQ